MVDRVTADKVSDECAHINDDVHHVKNVPFTFQITRDVGPSGLEAVAAANV